MASGLAQRMLSKQLQKQQSKMEAAAEPLSPLGERLLTEIKTLVSNGKDGAVSGMAPYVSLMSGMLAGVSDVDIRSALVAIRTKVDDVLSWEEAKPTVVLFDPPEEANEIK